MKKQKEKNPLNILFGRYIHNQRKKYKLSIDELSNKLGYSNGIGPLMAIENGMVCFTFVKIHLLLPVFKLDLIKLSQLSKFIFGAAFITNKMNQGLTARDAFKLLVDVDDEFGPLYYSYSRIIVSDEISLKKGSDNELILINLIQDFISGSYYKTIDKVTEKDMEEFLSNNKKECLNIIQTLHNYLILKKIKS